MKRPFLIMNPRSGGGKVAKFGLKDKAEALGAEVALLGGPQTVDVAELAGKAADAGADLLGVAGGDGTQALVAGVAAERHLPLLVIAAGTRNHFALDLGLDRDDPSTCLAALVDGVELHVDLAFLGGRPFVNNASFGAYAAVVQSSAYRDDKVGTTLQMLPDLLAGHRGPRLHAHAGQVSIDGPQAVLVSNNPYGTGDIAGLGRRARLDGGVLGVLAVTVTNAAQAAGLLRYRNRQGLAVLSAAEVVDEKSQIQALDRTAPVLPTQPHLIERRSHDYVRHGTTTLFAALEVATGLVTAAVKPRHRHGEFLAFLKQIARAYPDTGDGGTLHLITDNYAAHKHPKVKAWLAANPRIHVHFTPTHASWMNLVECWFSLAERQAIHRGTYTSVKDLNAKIRAYIDGWNNRAHPFTWTKTADQILAKANRKKISNAEH